MKIQDKLLKIDPRSPQPAIIREACRSIKLGGVICFPTRCLYGLAADAFNVYAIERIYKIKSRPFTNPILLLIKDLDDLNRVAKQVPPVAQNIISHFWPGEITIVLQAKDHLPEALTAGTGKIGVRIPQHPVAVALLNVLDAPITGTSANISSAKGCSRISDLDVRIAENIDLILDAGALKGGIGSTVVDVTTDPPKILREGEISNARIFEIL